MLQGGRHVHGAEDGIFQRGDAVGKRLRKKDGVGVSEMTAAAGVPNKQLGSRTGSVGTAAPDQRKQVFHRAGAQLIYRKRDGREHGGGVSAVRRIVASCYSDVFRHAVSCRKGGSEEHEGEPVIVADHGLWRSGTAEKIQRPIYITAVIAAVVNIVFGGRFPMFLQGLPIIGFPHVRDIGFLKTAQKTYAGSAVYGQEMGSQTACHRVVFQ